MWVGGVDGWPSKMKRIFFTNLFILKINDKQFMQKKTGKS